MKIIDKTPFLSEKGEIGLLDRLQGTLKFGLNWYPELEAQKAVISQLERLLERGFTLIRNHDLGASGIVIPLILLGPPGVFVMYVTQLRGMYRAKGDSWGRLSGERFQPASINLLTRTARLARALQVFLERQGVTLPAAVEPVLLAADPGLHVESVRPIVRVVMSDALKQFALSLFQQRPLFSLEAVHELVERILNPRPPKAAEPEMPPATPEQPPAEAARSRAQALFRSAEQAATAADISFALEDELPQEGVRPALIETSPAVPAARRPRAHAAARRRGMSGGQWAVLALMVIVEICVLIGFALLFFLPR